MTDKPWPEIRLTAFNTDPDSDNKIHSDDTAGKYGFQGGLVPGVSVYAYTTQALTARDGGQWLRENSRVSTKFISPVYDGDVVSVKGEDTDDGAKVQLFDSKGTLCAITEYALLDRLIFGLPGPQVVPLPKPEDRLPPRIDAMPEGHKLGSWSFKFDGEEHEAFCASMVDEQAAYRGDDPLWHPAWCLANANWMLMANVALGPWIHTGSVTNYISSPKLGSTLSLRGFVYDAYERRGHDMVDLSLSVLEGERIIAQIVHTAIICLAQDKA